MLRPAAFAAVSMLLALLSGEAFSLELTLWPKSVESPRENTDVPGLLAPRVAKPKFGAHIFVAGQEEKPVPEQPTPLVALGEPDFDERVVAIDFVESNGKEVLCSGLYIDALHVLTAKHCTCHDNDYLVTNEKNVFLPKAMWTDAVLEEGFQGGARCRRERDFDREEGNDLALLTLRSPLKTSSGKITSQCYSLLPYVALLDLWRKRKPARMWIAGFGATEFDGSATGVRAKASVPLNSTDCASRAARSLGCIGYREMIAGLRRAGVQPPDSCPGDSGGPAYLNVDGKFVPVGVISRGITSNSTNVCGDGGIYTLLGRTDVIAWLNKRLTVPSTNCSQLSSIARKGDRQPAGGVPLSRN